MGVECEEGVEGIDVEGEGDSTIHILQCNCLAMSKAGRESNERNGELPMGVRSDKFGNRVSKGGPRTYVKDGKRVFPVVHAPSREDDGDKMYARVLKQGAR